MLCFRKPPLLLDSFADANYLTATDKGIIDQTHGDYGWVFSYQFFGLTGSFLVSVQVCLGVWLLWTWYLTRDACAMSVGQTPSFEQSFAFLPLPPATPATPTHIHCSCK